MMKNRIFIALALLALVFTAAPAQGAGLGVIRDEETEQTLRIFSKPVFDQAGLSANAVRFILIDRNELNAFVAGGQNIFVFTGLILRTQDPGELFGVIAHETGHIANGDLIRMRAEVEDMSFQVMAATLLGIAVGAASGSAQAGAAVISAAGSVGQRALLRHSRVQETAADQSAVAYLKGARLPIGGLASFMRKLEDQELLPESQQAEYVRTHPLTRDRVAYLEAAAKQFNGDAMPPQWAELHARMVAKLKGYLFPDQALQDKGNSVAARYGRAIALYRKGKIEEALALLEPLIKAEPQNPYFYEAKGQMLFERGRMEESLAPYAKAVQLAPRSGLIRSAYGHALLESGSDPKRYTAAIAQFQLALQTEPKDIKTHHFLAISYGKQGQEGMSRLHLAEEQLLRGKMDYAIREAQLAQASLPKNSASWLRASDILDAAKRKRKEEKKDKKTRKDEEKD
ncbi:MAG TPA: M48 family metalloprotease [Patescibacteria group bacterium]|nr:M48 family metalloprotease [Patescibacteria group bacterium]